MRTNALTALALWRILLAGCASGRDADQVVDPASTGDADGDDGADEAVDDSGDGDADGPDECASISQAAVFVRRPVDIVFVIDNSTSMEEEIASIEQRIDQDLTRIIEESGIDYRVIMLSLYGDTTDDIGAYPVCISAPLGAGECLGENAPLVESERFFHYSSQVGSLNAGCQLLDGFALPDAARRGLDPTSGEAWAPRAPAGYQAWLREDAFKSIVIVGDDNLYCSRSGAPSDVFVDVHTEDLVDDRTPLHAADFDEQLRALSPEQFGTGEARNYKIHTIGGLAGNRALTASEPIVDTRCATAASDSWGYQELSILTGGLRYPVCRYDSYDEIFHAVAMDAIETSGLSCDWAIPAPEDGTLDPARVNLEYAPAGAAAEAVPQVPGAAGCADAPDGRAWYYDDPEDPAHVVSCPRLCDALKADATGKVRLAFGCETIVLL